MHIIIDSGCINCDMCVPECPNDAILMGSKHYEIEQSLCTQCEGFYDQPTCISVCPIGAVSVKNEVG
jgi:ferredoxin